MRKDYDITKTKLVIWDLDETFWSGNLTEGEVIFKPETIALVRELTTKGIMNSICSKNNFEDVRNKFVTSGLNDVWNLFVFPSIDWTPKGERVKNIIKSMNLREENVIFIDDNVSNINEVKFFSPQIMSATPELITKIGEELYLVNDYDFEHTRLKQYKILEEKNKQIAQSSSNEEFLRSSNIKICIKKDCLENIKRIKKLILRTNQLNFTKFRDENIEDTIKNNDCAYVIAEDKYGNYGICGFYALSKDNKNNQKPQEKLVHFLFSCRIMNMGIEQFVYNYLKRPQIEIVGEVASTLDGKVDWIELVEDLSLKKEVKSTLKEKNILFKGPCDLYSTLSYIDADCNIDTEFPYWNKQLIYILAHTHTAFIEQTHRLSQSQIAELSMRFPFPNPDEFKTKFFDSKYDVIFLSLLTVTHSGIYINKNDGTYAFFGFADCDITDENNWEKILAPIPAEARAQNILMLKEFKNNYIFGGNPPVELVIKNLNYILENLHAKLVLILGSEIPTNKIQAGYDNMAERHKMLNSVIKKEFKDRVEFIELTDFIKNDEDYTTCINHFSRRVYVDLAQKIVEIGNKALGEECLKLKKEN